MRERDHTGKEGSVEGEQVGRPRSLVPDCRKQYTYMASAKVGLGQGVEPLLTGGVPKLKAAGEAAWGYQ